MESLNSCLDSGTIRRRAFAAESQPGLIIRIVRPSTLERLVDLGPPCAPTGRRVPSQRAPRRSDATEFAVDSRACRRTQATSQPLGPMGAEWLQRQERDL